MSRSEISRVITLALLISIAMLSILPQKSFAQPCNVRARVVQNTNIFVRTPVFSSSRGWDYGAPVASLSQGTEIYICRKETISFGFQSQRWAQISYFINDGWQFGWVRLEVLSIVLQMRLPEQKSSNSFVSLFFVSKAHAGMLPHVPQAETPPVGSKPPDLPANLVVKESTYSLNDSSALISFYSALFFAMVVGMIAKCIFDSIQVGKNTGFKSQVRQIVVPLLVSPMVFLTFMQAADFLNVGMKGFLILNLMSFQNGFFWQTVIGTNSTPATEQKPAA